MRVFKIQNAYRFVIQTTVGRKNLECIKWMLPRSFASLWMTYDRTFLF